MIDNFTPAIKSRTTVELLEIVGSPKKWNERALKLALEELYNRKINGNQIDQAKYIEKRQIAFESLKKAKESYTFLDFLFEPASNFFEILFSWELEEDGYILKAKQQRKYRPIIIFIIMAIIISFFFLF